MSKEYPCVHWHEGKCKKFSDDTVVSWCVESPCEDQLLSNADRIRAMSDEELAKFLECFGLCHYCNEHHRLGDLRIYADEKCDEKCVEHCLEWLKQPKEE